MQTDPASGKRYRLTSAASGTVSAAATITGTYVAQYRLDLATDPAAVGISNISGATDGSWHDAGTTVNLTATTPVAIDATSRYRFDHWQRRRDRHRQPGRCRHERAQDSHGQLRRPVPADARHRPPVADLGAPTSRAACQRDGFYDAGTVLSICGGAAVAIDAGSRWRFDELEGRRIRHLNPVSVTMSAARSVTADYVTQFKLTLST